MNVRFIEKDLRFRGWLKKTEDRTWGDAFWGPYYMDCSSVEPMVSAVMVSLVTLSMKITTLVCQRSDGRADVGETVEVSVWSNHANRLDT